MLPLVLVADPSPLLAAAGQLLEGHARIRHVAGPREQLLAEIEQASVLWVRLAHAVDAELLARGARLLAVATATTGLNHIDVGEATRRGMAVLSLAGETAFLRDVRATAEHTLALALAMLRQLPAALRHVQQGGWDRGSFQGAELFRKTVGIVGYGRLGRIVARYFLAFGARVLANDPGVLDVEPGIERVGLPQLLAEADLVSLHVSLDPSTRGFFGAREIELMKPGARLINTSRGELLDEGALLAALRSGRLRGAALDVLADERASGMGGHPLVAYAHEHAELLITPHIGGWTAESQEKTERFLAEKIARFLQGSAR